MQRLALIALASVTCLMSEARATSLDSQVIATDLSFIETQVSKTLTSLGSSRCPKSPISGLGRRYRNVDDDESFERKPRMDKRVFPGPALASLSGDRVAEMARCGAGVDRPTGHAGQGPPVRPHGHRLHHRDEFRQRIPADGRPKLQGRASTPQATHCRRSTIQRSGRFTPGLSLNYHFAVIVDSMMTLGPLQWGAGNGGSSTWAGMAATHAQTVTTNLVRLGRQHVSGRRF